MWRLILLLASIVGALSPDQSDYEALEENSKSLTKELLSLDLGYNVLNNEFLRKNLNQNEAEDKPEALPQPAGLIQHRADSILPATNWNDDKFWGGPSPFFFPDFGFGRPSRPVSAASVKRPFRRHRPPAPKTFVGDQHQCSTGSCEFFLFCWLGGGIIQGNCGGFLFACCLRPDGGRNSEAIVEKVSFFWTKDFSSLSKIFGIGALFFYFAFQWVQCTNSTDQSGTFNAVT